MNRKGQNTLFRWKELKIKVTRRWLLNGAGSVLAYSSRNSSFDLKLYRIVISDDAKIGTFSETSKYFANILIFRVHFPPKPQVSQWGQDTLWHGKWDFGYHFVKRCPAASKKICRSMQKDAPERNCCISFPQPWHIISTHHGIGFWVLRGIFSDSPEHLFKLSGASFCLRARVP